MSSTMANVGCVWSGNQWIGIVIMRWEPYVVELNGIVYSYRITSETTSRCAQQRELTLGKLIDGLIEMFEATHHICKTRSGPEILLLQAKLLPNYRLSVTCIAFRVGHNIHVV